MYLSGICHLTEAGKAGKSKVVNQHTELEHTPKPLPTGYNGIPGVCDIGVCCNFLGEYHYRLKSVLTGEIY